VLVRRDGDLVHWSAHDLPGRDDTIPTEALPSSWADESGRFVVSVRVDDADTWESFDLGARDGECYGVEARVTDEGDQSLWYERDPDTCGGSTTVTDG
jgi:hypothetical protein